MEVHIQGDGTMVVTPNTESEYYALTKWWESYHSDGKACLKVLVNEEGLEDEQGPAPGTGHGSRRDNMKAVSELAGAELDYWVAKATGESPVIEWGSVYLRRDKDIDAFRPSVAWGDGGPFIEQWRVNVLPQPQGDWGAEIGEGEVFFRGRSPLEAVCRVVVASVYEDHVPEDSDDPEQ